MRILSVDDDAQNLYLIEAVGRALECEVISARNGIEALAQLNRNLPDLIISDILMPEMDGFQLCHEVKSHERTRGIPFIFYTATYTAKQDEELGLSLGASRFIIKPLDPERFMEVIKDVAAEAKRGETRIPMVDPRNTIEYLRLYNSRLVSKLDHKIEQLEASKEALWESLAARDLEIAQRERAEEERAKMEAQFLHAQKLESVGRLAGGIAHDFNNLLTIINLHSELLLKELREGDPMRRGMQEIRTAGERAAILTKQLLAFSRRQVLDARPLNLSRSVEEIQGMVRSLLGDHIEVVTRLASKDRVVMDEGQVHQVLLNLIVNAKDAMPGGGRLTVETADVEADAVQGWETSDVQPGPGVLLSVTDDGTGMDREIQERIFEPFFTTKVEGEGTGLGLSTVYGIVRQSGGWIWVDSKRGMGSTFRIWLPKYSESEVAVTGAPNELLGVLEPPAQRRETVIVVEDYETVRSVMVIILRNHGYEVLEAENGLDALALVDRHGRAVDLLVTDVQMPHMDGQELAAQLKVKLPQLRVLFASAHPAEGWDETILAVPGVGWISKPFTPEALVAKVRDVLDEPVRNAKAAKNT